MSNSSSKTPVRRFKRTGQILCWAAASILLSHATQAQNTTVTPRVTWAPTGGLRIGELAPQLQLPDSAGKLFNSQTLLGQKPLFLLLDGPTPTLNFNPDITAAAQKADAKGIALALAALNSQIGQDYAWPTPFTTLRAPDGSLKNVAPPAFLAIDRAGWLREIESLPTTANDTQSLRLQLLLQQPDPTPKLEVGQIAPDFSFRDANGNWRRVSALRGRKNLLLTFFPKCFTGKCRTHLSSLRDEFPAFMATQTEIWAVSADTAEGENGQLAFAKDLTLPFPLLPDTGRNISLLYGAANTPTDLAQRQSVLIDKNGIVRWITKNVNVDTHSQDVLAKITALHMVD